MPSANRIEIRPDEQNESFVVDPPIFRWNRSANASIPIKNSTGSEVVCWFPEYTPPMLSVADGRTGVCHKSHTAHLASGTKIEYAVYVTNQRVFAEGNSAPKMILDP